MNHAKNLDKASGNLFLLGFVTAKLRQLPIPFVGQVLGLLSYSCYLIAYALWLVASHFYPDHPPKKEDWYGFAQIKHQNRIGAAIGFAGITLCLLSIPFPILLLPGASLFALSNIFWSIAEYHRRQNPPKDEPYSPARQNYYLSYAILSTFVSVISAASLALVLIFPPIGVPAFFFSSLISYVLTIAAFYFLLSTPKTLDVAEPGTKSITSSTAIISQHLSSSKLEPKQTNQHGQLTEAAPGHQLFQKEKIVEETTIPIKTPTNTCTSPSTSYQ